MNKTFLFFCLAAVPCAFGDSATREWDLGPLHITTPVEYAPGVPFPVRFDLRVKHGEPERMEIRFNYLARGGAFAGSLHNAGTGKIFSDVGVLETELVIPENPVDLALALLTVFLSPDGSWEKRTLQANVPLLPVGGDRDLYATAAERALTEGATNPLNVEGPLEEYTPRAEYFTQRTEDPEGREWVLEETNFPALDAILARPASAVSPVGIYCWADEYLKAQAEIARIGIRSVRMAGPWAGADAAMRAAAENGVEVFYTLQIGADMESYRQGRRPNFESDEAFAQAFHDDVAAFLRRYGPGGTFEETYGVVSPVVAIGLWNEPNFQYMIPNSGDQDADEAAREALYPHIVRAGSAAARSTAPEVKVVAFSTGGADFADKRFIRNIHLAYPDLPDNYDILATHPYNKGAPPEARKINFWGLYSIADGRAVIRDLFEELGRPEPPVWYTELGWAVAQKHGGRFPATANRVRNIVTPDLQAAYVVRAYLLAPRLGVERIFIMNLHDTDGFNAGFMHRDTFAWRPVAYATRHLLERLPRPRLLEARHDGADGLFAYRYQADGRAAESPDVWVLWNVMGPRAIELPWEGERARLTDMVGNERVIEAIDGHLRLTIGPYPIYVERP
ncbi:MAG: hypothetical protein JJT96_16430 [Opitutales bacterium]|nr:hypothetical protein [Opitutales bacterium]